MRVGDEPVRVRDADELDTALEAPLTVIYKHSPYCGLSALACREVRQFMKGNPGIPVYMVDVVRDRTVSAEVARRFGIRHESPQVIVVRDGEPSWNASHRGVVASALQREAGA